MSKIAIISDIHSNIDALNLILKDIERKNVDKIICLGDIVTKYYYPAEVVDCIKENASIVLKGNCDNLVTNNEMYKFTREKLKFHRIEYLNNLETKFQILVNKVLIYLYHSNPNNLESIFNPLFNKNEYTNYRNNIIYDYKNMFVSDIPQVSIVGHTHQNFIGIEENNNLKIFNTSEAFIKNDDRAIINVGSCGEHNKLIYENDSYIPIIDPYLTYVIIDDKIQTDGINIQMIKVPYKETLKKVYIDMVDLQEKGLIPYSPKDTKKILNSILSMENSIKNI